MLGERAFITRGIVATQGNGMVRNWVWEEPQDEKQERAGRAPVCVAGEGQLSSEL